MKQCGECGQAIKKARYEVGTCERCEELEDLREQVEELEDELRDEKAETTYLQSRLEQYRERAEIHDSIRELFSLGCSCAEAIDYAFCERHGHNVQEWARNRGVTPPAVYNNISSAQRALDNQSTISEFPVGELPELERFPDAEPAITRVDDGDESHRADGMGSDVEEARAQHADITDWMDE